MNNSIIRIPFISRVLLLAACSFIPFSSAPAFDVIKDVTKPPVEKIVIFEKGKPTDHLSFVDDPNCKLSFTPDGAIECRIIGNSEIKPMIKWKAKPGLPAGFLPQDYDYIILTCRMEGNNKSTSAQGKVTETRAGNLWFGFSIFDANGERMGSASLADATADNKTPDTTAVLKFPMIVIRFWDMNKMGEVQAIGFPWGKTRPEINRDFRLIIDKIAVAVDAK